jgi:hypothetical protein
MGSTLSASAGQGQADAVSTMTMQRHKSVSRRVLSKVKQGLSSRSRASLSIRPTESENSLRVRLTGIGQHMHESERRTQSFEIRRDGIADTTEHNFTGASCEMSQSLRSCTASTVPTSELVQDEPSTPLACRNVPAASCGSMKTSEMPSHPQDMASLDRTPCPSHGAVNHHASPEKVLPSIDLTVTVDHQTIEGHMSQEVWVAVEAVARGTAYQPDLNVIGTITSFRLCFKPATGCRVTAVLGQKIMKGMALGQTCSLFVKLNVPSEDYLRDTQTEQDSLFSELESLVGTLETEILHIEARYRLSLLPHDNIVTVRQTAKARRSKPDSRWSIVDAYSDIETAEQTHIKLATYLADTYTAEKALKYIDRLLATELEQEGSLRQIRRRVLDDAMAQKNRVADNKCLEFDKCKPAVLITGIDSMPDHLAVQKIESITDDREDSKGTLTTTALPLPSRVASLAASPSTTAIDEYLPALASQGSDAARCVWHHIRRSSWSTNKLADLATDVYAEHLTVVDDGINELRKKALANKRSIGAETLRSWRWDSQVRKLGDAPWL